MAAAIEFRDVVKLYGEVVALDTVNLAVSEGEVFGFLGPNGAGKTTSIRILFDLIRPTQGSAAVLGIDCQKQGVQARSKMGYLPGELRLYENMSGRELFGLFASLERSSDAEAYAATLCERFDLDPSIAVGSYSKGNKQKAGLILALMNRPPVLVLDEPTSGLDPLVQEEFASLLQELSAAGHTVFFSSHVLSEVERMCHRVAIIRRGRIVVVEDVAQLKGRSLHVIEVTFAQPVPAGAFDLPGVRELRRDGDLVHLQVQSNLDGALKAIARYPVVDLRTEQPSLEQVFLAYYEGKPGLSAAREDEAVHV